MRNETELEKQRHLDMPQQLHIHRLRIEDWAKIKEWWIPSGLTCPKYKTDHCEIDGHSC